MMIRSRAMRRLSVEMVFWLVLVIVMWVYSYDFARPIAHNKFDVVTWPRAILLLIAVIAIFSFVTQRRRILAAEHSGGASAEEGSEVSGDSTAGVLIAATIALPLIYVGLLPGMGFFVLTPFFIAGYMFIFRQRKLIHLTVTAFAAYATIAFIFSKLLYLPLPTGNWPGFYEFGTAVVETLDSL